MACRRRDHEIARHVAQNERDSEQNRLLTIERDEALAQLANSKATREKVEKERALQTRQTPLRVRPSANVASSPAAPHPGGSYAHLPSKEVPHDFGEPPC